MKRIPVMNTKLLLNISITLAFVGLTSFANSQEAARISGSDLVPIETELFTKKIEDNDQTNRGKDLLEIYVIAAFSSAAPQIVQIFSLSDATKDIDRDFTAESKELQLLVKGRLTHDEHKNIVMHYDIHSGSYYLALKKAEYGFPANQKEFLSFYEVGQQVLLKRKPTILFREIQTRNSAPLAGSAAQTAKEDNSAFTIIATRR